MAIPNVIRQKASTFLENNEFDFYIGNHFSESFLPQGPETLILERVHYSNLATLEQKYQKRGGRIVAFGAGTVFDSAKYIAKATESHLTIIPSALSVNSFATHRSSFFVGRTKKSFETTPPESIVLDLGLLKSGSLLNMMGVVEIAATATAQIDWTIATRKGIEPGNEGISKRAAFLVDSALELLRDLQGLSVHLEQLFNALLESGLLTQEYGVGRPVSGSEHIISSYIENEIECPHGVGLYVGILIAASLQGNAGYHDPRVNAISKALYKASPIREYLVKKLNPSTVSDILAHITPRADKYTILDEISPEQLSKTTREICDTLFRQPPN
jgi:glycerol dehydrogenase-like iron-containing ADH family enzyme